jgi:hypothetical protein
MSMHGDERHPETVQKVEDKAAEVRAGPSIDKRGAASVVCWGGVVWISLFSTRTSILKAQVAWDAWLCV